MELVLLSALLQASEIVLCLDADFVGHGPANLRMIRAFTSRRRLGGEQSPAGMSRLYVAESAGMNLPRVDLEQQLPNGIVRLEDTDGDGKFDKQTVFADKMTFPQGALWHDGSVYAASSGGIWKLTDHDDNGVAAPR